MSDRITARSIRFCSSPHIAGPIVCNECIHGCLRYLFNVLPHATCEHLDEMQDQLSYVLSALPQGWNQDGKYVQPIVKITAEFIPCDHVIHIAMSGSDQSHVDVMRTAAAQPLELLFLQNAQKFRLQSQRQVPDFVQKESAGISPFQSGRLFASLPR